MQEVRSKETTKRGEQWPLLTLTEEKEKVQNALHTAQSSGSPYFTMQELPFIVMTKSARKTI